MHGRGTLICGLQAHAVSAHQAQKTTFQTLSDHDPSPVCILRCTRAATRRYIRQSRRAWSNGASPAMVPFTAEAGDSCPPHLFPVQMFPMCQAAASRLVHGSVSSHVLLTQRSRLHLVSKHRRLVYMQSQTCRRAASAGGTAHPAASRHPARMATLPRINPGRRPT